MSADGFIDVIRDATKLVLLIGGPALLVTLIVGVISGFVQSAFHVQDNSVSIVPRLIATGLVVVIGLPWYLDLLVEYTRDVITAIPNTL